MESEIEILKQLLDYYTTKYPGKEGNEKFHDMSDDLIRQGDIQKATYLKFCITHNVDPRIHKEVKKKSSSSSTSWGTDPCGSSRTTRSSC